MVFSKVKKERNGNSDGHIGSLSNTRNAISCVVKTYLAMYNSGETAYSVANFFYC
jgi:hypothetical protein